MPRRALIAIFFLSALWAATAQLAYTAPDPVMAMIAAEERLPCGDEHRPADSGDRWRAAQYQAHATVTESPWRSTEVHAALAGAHGGALFISMGTTTRPPHSVTSDGTLHGPPRLVTSPLLI